MQTAHKTQEQQQKSNLKKMGRIPKQTFFQRQTDGKQAHRKIFNITNS